MTEVKEQVPEFSDLSDDKQDLKNNEHWVQETEKLLAEFKIDTVQLQNDCRKKIKQVLEDIYNEEGEEIVVEAITSNILKVVDPSERAQASQWANSEKVLEDIEAAAVFDDILIEFSQVL